MSDEAEGKKGKKKKEKKPKKEKPKKEKKPKEKKPKKEKPPKPKKEKKGKKGKEAPEGAEGEEGGKKKGPPLLLILIPAFVVLLAGIAAAVIFIVLPKLRGGADAEAVEPEDPDAALSAQVENTERAKKGDKKSGEGEGGEGDGEGEGGDGEASGDAETDADTEIPDEEGGEPVDGEGESDPDKPVDIVVAMTTSESIAFFRGLSPSMLGLPGETMDDYDIFASEHLIMVDDVPCKEFHVYSIGDRTGTNIVEGLYLMTQRGARKLYRLDEANNTVTEIEYTPPAPPAPEPVPEPAEEPPEPDDHM